MKRAWNWMVNMRGQGSRDGITVAAVSKRAVFNIATTMRYQGLNTLVQRKRSTV